MSTSTAPTPPGETVARRSEPRLHSGGTFLWSVVLILAVGFLAWLLIGYWGTDSFETLDQKRVKERQEILKKRTEDDAKLLNDPPSYQDKTKGTIRVPLDRALALTLKDLQNDKPRVAYPLSKSPPQPAAIPSGSAPAASPSPGASPGGSAAPGASPAAPVAPATATPAPAPAASVAPVASPAPTPAAQPPPSTPPATQTTNASGNSAAPAESPQTSPAPSASAQPSATPSPSAAQTAPVPTATP